MRTIGLTGGIGSGKSTVAKMLAQASLPVMDADVISRNVTQPGGVAIPLILQTWGENILTADGSLNRDAMRSLMLQDASAKAKLEAIIHPLVGQELDAQLARAKRAGAKLAVLDIPLLVEGGIRWRGRLDAVWVVDCLLATQVERVKARSGWAVAQIEAVMAVQASRAQRLACADAVISNEGLSLEQLREQVLTLVAQENLKMAV